MQKPKQKNGLRRFIATVHEQFSGTYEAVLSYILENDFGGGEADEV